MKKLLDAELRAAAATAGCAHSSMTRELESQLEEIRRQGISRASGSLTPGINGFSAPVFDHSGRMVAAVTSLGTIGHFDMEWNSPLARRIKAAAAALSIRLGHNNPKSGEDAEKLT